jgi:hypothetical protein
MRLTKILLITLIAMCSGSIFAEDTAMLINLDKQWRSDSGPDGFVLMMLLVLGQLALPR